MVKFVKHVVFICIIFAIFCIQIPTSFAQTDTDFIVGALTTYVPQESGEVFVTQEITLTNTKEFVYTPSYSIALKLKNISNIKTSNSKGPIPYKLQEGENNTKIVTINFPERTVGINAKNNFTVSFTTTDYLKTAGKSYTVSIPAITNIQDFAAYEVLVTVPESFGNASIVKPDVPYNSSNSVYVFSKENISKSGIFIVFGDRQYYRFKLSYNLENKNLYPVITEIALPPDTAYQKIILENISPKPQSVYKDKDGNTLAKYSLDAKSGYKVRADVLVDSSFKPSKTDITEDERKAYTRPQKYWETESSEIKKIAKNLRSSQEIFNYIVKSLSYGTSKTNVKNERLGALKSLRDPFFAGSLEFTDLFITLARSSGIPARAIEGYAYTQNDLSRPTDLFQDVLHAWPEYYDDTQKTWVMVDPTWTDTTGVDFFKVFDLDHVTFVKNGLSSTYPVPAGGYKSGDSKDVEVSFADVADFKKVSRHIITGNFSPFTNGSFIQGSVTYLNLGNYETHPEDISIFLDSKKVSTITFPKTPPLGSSVISVNIPRSQGILGSLTNVSHTITMQDSRKKVLFEKQIRVFPISLPILGGGVLLLGSIIIFIIAIKTRGLPIFRRKR